MASVQPLIFEPIYKPKIWGGDRIFRFFDRPRPDNEPVGESWELADLEEDKSLVAWGPAKGQTLGHLIADWGGALMGHVSLFEGRFPLLIKFLDARESLSVQVHPNESLARQLGGTVRVKHEAWYILDAVPDGAIYHGLEPGVDARTFREAMTTGRIDGVLRRVRVRPGDCYYLPSGTVHALGAGVLVAEVQTPSDITYRTYDWGRIDPSGKPRDLHLDEAMACIDFDAPSPPPMQERSHVGTVSTSVTRLVSCPSFTIEKVRMSEGTRREMPYEEPVVWIVLEGRGRIEWSHGARSCAFGKGNVVLLPSALPQAFVVIDEPTHWLEVTVPIPSDLANYERPAPEHPATPPASGYVQLNVPRAKPAD